MIYEVMDSYMSHKIKANVQNKPSFSLDSFCKQELCKMQSTRSCRMGVDLWSNSGVYTHHPQ